jgi:hypothetical protein
MENVWLVAVKCARWGGGQVEGTTKSEGRGGRERGIEVGLTGRLGRRFGQGAVARVSDTHWGLVDFGSLGVLCCVGCGCAVRGMDVVGTKTRVVGGCAGGMMEKAKTSSETEGWREGEKEGHTQREREIEREITDRLIECREQMQISRGWVGNSGSRRKRMWCLSCASKGVGKGGGVRRRMARNLVGWGMGDGDGDGDWGVAAAGWGAQWPVWWTTRVCVPVRSLQHARGVWCGCGCGRGGREGGGAMSSKTGLGTTKDWGTLDWLTTGPGPELGLTGGALGDPDLGVGAGVLRRVGGRYRACMQPSWEGSKLQSVAHSAT